MSRHRKPACSQIHAGFFHGNRQRSVMHVPERNSESAEVRTVPDWFPDADADGNVSRDRVMCGPERNF